MKRSTVIFAALLTVIFGAVLSCGPTKLQTIETQKMSAKLVLAKESEVPELEYRATKKDTIIVKDDKGKEMILMKAVRDEASGEMVANEVLEAAVVTARFRNVAERHGKIDLQFQIIVPKDMQDSKWQLRFYPDMFILGDSLRLEPVIITGDNYRRAQLKGYQQYEKWLSTIISDTTHFIDLPQLERFLQRNIPQLFAFKTDSTEVSDEIFYSVYGVSEQQAVEHYTDYIAKRRNQRKIASRDRMFRRYVKAPIVSQGIRLDTVMRSFDGDFIYNYTQTINTRPKLRKVDIVLSGDIYEQDKRLYNIPPTEPLTFYISSVSSFADKSEHYLTKVIERRAAANASYKIEFKLGKADVVEDFGDNATQMGFVKDNLVDLLNNEEYDLDSIVIVANASPEGSWKANGALSKRRGESVVHYFEGFMRDYKRQLAREGGFEVDEEGNIISASSKIPKIHFISHSVPENWTLLDRLVSEDSRLKDSQKERYFYHSDIKDMDQRESAMKSDDYYRFMVDSLYPSLRVVDFSFLLHRKGMVKDTIHTTELDERYMEGVQLLKDMDYDGAVKILGPYQDYNSAVAYMGAERNASAMLILSSLERTPQVNYLMAILYARLGDERQAVQCYMDAVKAEPTYRHRGNLDPEISALIKLYGLNKTLDDEDDLGL